MQKNITISRLLYNIVHFNDKMAAILNQNSSRIYIYSFIMSSAYWKQLHHVVQSLKIDIYAKNIKISLLLYTILHFKENMAAILNFNTPWRHWLNESYIIVLPSLENMGVDKEIFSLRLLVFEICAIESPKWRPFWILAQLTPRWLPKIWTCFKTYRVSS